ncbi:MAG: prolipoprotein diacylglyceryl transferase [Solirubrobacteraceae bacterium]
MAHPPPFEQRSSQSGHSGAVVMSAFGFISSPSEAGFHIGPLFVHVYGLSYVVGVGAAILLTRELWKREGGDPKLPAEVALWAFPAGLIGARIYFLITTPGQIPPHWWGPFAIWKGGLGSWGGIAAGVAAAIWVLRRRLDRTQVRRFMDVATPSILVATACVRVGNYFNQELFGKPSALPWALKVDPAHRPPGYVRFATFQPTFLYEIIFNLIFAAILIGLVRSRRIRPPGVFALYVAGYSGYRIFEETLRIDYSNYILGMRLNFWIALILCLVSIAWFVVIQRQWRIPWPWRRQGAAAQRRA